MLPKPTDVFFDNNSYFFWHHRTNPKQYFFVTGSRSSNQHRCVTPLYCNKKSAVSKVGFNAPSGFGVPLIKVHK
jgi:hypothetical protein